MAILPGSHLCNISPNWREIRWVWNPAWALALAGGIPVAKEMVERLFLAEEIKYYMRLVNNSPLHLFYGSTYRWLCVTGLCDIQTYEGEAAMKLGLARRSAKVQLNDFYQFGFTRKRAVIILRHLFGGSWNSTWLWSTWDGQNSGTANLILQQSRHYNCVRKWPWVEASFQNAFGLMRYLNWAGDNIRFTSTTNLAPMMKTWQWSQLALFHLHNSKIKHSNFKTTVTCV